MWHIILQIFAVLGIVILCILGLLLLAVVLLLFVPVRYRAEGSKTDQEAALRVKASWLFHLVTFRYVLHGEKRSSLRILGIPISVLGKKNTDAGKTDAETKETSLETPSERMTEDIPKEQAEENTVKESTEPEAKEQEDAAPPDKNQPEEKKGLFDRLKGKIEKCIYTIRSACDKIKNIVKNISYYKEVLTAEENRRLYERLLVRLKKVLKSIFPRRLRVQLLAGTGAPDTTGYLCALYGMLLPFCGKKRKIRFEADFEKKRIEGSFFLKGRLILFPLAVQACGIFFDRQLRTFLKQLKQEEK